LSIIKYSTYKYSNKTCHNHETRLQNGMKTYKDEKNLKIQLESIHQNH